MQRPTTYGQSPPLHHPVPQHVSTVPQLRSPPPPVGSAQPGQQQQQPQQDQQHQHQQQQQQQQQQGNYGNPYQQQPGAPGNAFGQYGNLINDPTAQLASQFGQTAFRQGQEYIEQSVHRYVSVSALKHYFQVSNSYVLNKIFLVLFPWRHKPWTRKQTTGPNGQEGWYLPPREDINSPDMYIPVMALVTYVLLSTMIAGIRGQFQPDLLGNTAMTASIIIALEISVLKLGCYLLGITNNSQLLEMVAYSGYKFVGAIVTTAVAETVNGGKGTGGWIGWLVFFITYNANSFFLLRSLKYVLIPESAGDSRGPMQTSTDTRARKNQRTQFLFFYSYIVQLVFIWMLTKS